MTTNTVNACPTIEAIEKKIAQLLRLLKRKLEF
jgi:hypothetical protein